MAIIITIKTDCLPRDDLQSQLLYYYNYRVRCAERLSGENGREDGEMIIVIIITSTRQERYHHGFHSNMYTGRLVGINYTIITCNNVQGRIKKKNYLEKFKIVIFMS